MKDWGPGIPAYTEDDLLKGLELHGFCTNIAAKALQEKGYTITSVFSDSAPTQVVAQKGGRQYAALVAGGVYPAEGRISWSMPERFVEYRDEMDTVPLFMSVGLMADDPARSLAGLALKYDGYRIRIGEPEDLTDFQPPAPGDAEYEAYCVEKILDAYRSGFFEPLFDLLADGVQLHSQWVLTPIVGKEELVRYFTGKGRTLRNSDARLDGEVVRIRGGQKKSGNVTLLSEPGKLCVLLKQELRGNTVRVFISPDFDQDHKLCRICLNDPEMFDFEPCYAFQ